MSFYLSSGLVSIFIQQILFLGLPKLVPNISRGLNMYTCQSSHLNDDENNSDLVLNKTFFLSFPMLNPMDLRVCIHILLALYFCNIQYLSHNFSAISRRAKVKFRWDWKWTFPFFHNWLTSDNLSIYTPTMLSVSFPSGELFHLTSISCLSLSYWVTFKGTQAVILRPKLWF